MSIHGPHWTQAVAVARYRPRSIQPGDIPSRPGVYIWFREGEPVYVGEAKGRLGLRGRLRAHLAVSADLSRSTLRASVAVAELGLTRAYARRRPSVITDAEVEHVNEWLNSCELGWHECATAVAAHELEARLRREWMPPLNML
jgi:hypothetical protein